MSSIAYQPATGFKTISDRRRRTHSFWILWRSITSPDQYCTLADSPACHRVVEDFMDLILVNGVAGVSTFPHLLTEPFQRGVKGTAPHHLFTRE